LGGNYRRHLNKENPLGTGGVVVEQFAGLLRQMWNGQDVVVAPYQFKDKVGDFNPQFQGNEQHDSQEFLAFLLDAIHEDLNVARSKSKGRKLVEEPKDDESIPEPVRQGMAWEHYKAQNWSVVVDLFQGQLKSKLQCMTCDTTSTTFNPFMYLSLPIPETRSGFGKRSGTVNLEDCLRKFQEVEILDGDDAWHCPKCKCQRRTAKTLTVAKVPAILLVHLKRFYYQGPFKNKVDTCVDIPLKGLDMGPHLPTHITSLGGGGGIGPNSFVYDLYAVSNHMGTLTGGHYTANVYNGSKQQWYQFDDSRLSACSESSVKVSEELWRVDTCI
jgi:ubiquitin carboxyl-terminal hydrolase 8